MSNAMRKGKQTLAGVAAGALGLSLVSFVGMGAANAAVDGSSATATTSVYLTNTQALVNRGSIAAIPATYTAARVTVTSGSVGAYGRPLSGSGYAATGSWNTVTTSAAFGISEDAATGPAPTAAALDDFVGLTATSAASATVQMWQDLNNNGVIDIGENAGVAQTVNFVAPSSVAVTVAPAWSTVANNTANTYTVSAGVGANALQQDEDNTAIGSTSATDWTIGSFYVPTGATTATGVAAATANPSASTTVAASTTAGTVSITGYLDPAGATAAVTTAPTGSQTGTGSFTVRTTAESPVAVTTAASGTGVIASGSNYVARLTATSVTWSATVVNGATPAVPVAGVSVQFTVNGTQAVSVDGGTAATGAQTAFAVTNAAGVATITVSRAAPADANSYTVAVAKVANATVTAAAKTLTYNAGTAVNAVASTINGVAMSTTGASPNTINVVSNATSSLVATATNVFGDPVANTSVYVKVGAAGAPPTATLTTDSAGKATYTVGGISSSTQNVYVSSTLTGGNVTTGNATGASTLSYAAAADITPGAVTVTAPATATTITTTQGTAQVVSGGRVLVTFNVKNSATTPANLANAYVTATVTGGTLFATDPGSTSTISQGSASLPGQTDVGGNFSVYVASASTGPVVVTLTADTKSASTTNITASNAGATAAGIAIAPTGGGVVPVAVASDSVTSMTAIVSDTNGNGLGLSGVEVSLTGDATFAANGAKTLVGLTASNGRFSFDVKAGRSGSFTVTATSTTVPSVTLTTPAIAVEDEKAIVIAAYRSGGAVVVDGDAVGFERGDTVNIRVRYYNANKKKYTSWRGAGTAIVKSNGGFSGFINTDKQVRIKVNGGGVVSNIVTVK